jgi:conjugative transposon TraM protein
MAPDAKQKKIVAVTAFSILGLLIVSVGLLVLKPSGNEQQIVEGQRVLNTELPAAEQIPLHETKQEAYIEATQEAEWRERMKSIGVDNSGDINLSENSNKDSRFNQPQTPQSFVNGNSGVMQMPPSDLSQNRSDKNSGFGTSQQNRQGDPAMDAWYQTMQNLDNQDAEKRRKEEQELERRREDEERHQRQQEELMQRAREQQEFLNEIIRQQMGGSAEAKPMPTTPTQADERQDVPRVQPMSVQETGVVSSMHSRKRQGGFFGTAEVTDQKNTIRAQVYGEHIIETGQFVRFRLQEPMQVGRAVLQTGSVLIGRATIGEDRLFVHISSVEQNEVIYQVNIAVYDLDGMIGLNLPGSMEMEAAREIGVEVANAMGNTATSSSMFQVQQSAAEQLKAEAGRGLIQGTFRYAGKRLSKVKVTVQDKHRVYLVPVGA